MVSTWAHTNTRSSTRVTPSSAEQVREQVRHRRRGGRPLVEPQGDPRGVPQQQRGGDGGDQRQDEVGLAHVAALEAPRALHLADPERADHPDQHQHREHVDQERVPALVTQPRERRVLGDHPDHGDHDRRAQHEEAPEDEGVDEARADALQQLALAQHDRRLVLGAPRAVAGALDRRPRPQQRHQEAHADGEQAPAHRQRGGEQDGGDGDAYVPRTFLISAEIAGTTSCRSPITA